MFFFPAFSFDSFFAFLSLCFRVFFLEAASVELALSKDVPFLFDGGFSIFDLLPIGGPLPKSGLP